MSTDRCPDCVWDLRMDCLWKECPRHTKEELKTTATEVQRNTARALAQKTLVMALDVPHVVADAARTLKRWAEQNDLKDWQVLGIGNK